jgi:DNA-binding HxlR family transcriptional regulator
MPDYGKFCPVSMGAEVLADRWTPLILRELIIGSTRFNDIARGLPGISRSLLVQRLRHLERRGVLERWPSPTGKGSEYVLTEAGRDLQTTIMALGEWSVRWLYTETRPRDVDPRTLLWWMHRLVDRDALPARRVVVEFAFTGPDAETVWVLLEQREVSVCYQHPGFDSDVVVRATTGDLSDVFNGIDTWAAALESGRVRAEGPPREVRALARWFRPSPFAPAMAAEHARRGAPPGQAEAEPVVRASQRATVASGSG